MSKLRWSRQQLALLRRLGTGDLRYAEYHWKTAESLIRLGLAKSYKRYWQDPEGPHLRAALEGHDYLARLERMA